MEASSQRVMTWKRIILLLGRLLFLHLVTIRPVHGACISSLRARTHRCSPELLSRYSLVSGPHSGVESIDCVRMCAEYLSCGLAVSEMFSDGRKSCNLLTLSDYGQGSTLNVSISQTCETAELNQCKNSGWMENGVCVCPDKFKGEYCEHVNPRPCNAKWTKILSYDKSSGELTVHNSTLLDSASYLVPKLRVRDDVCSYWALNEIMSVRENKSLFFPHEHLSKSCVDSYEPNAKRRFVQYSTNRSFQILQTNGQLKGVFIDDFPLPDTEIWSVDTSSFEKIELKPDNINTMKKALQSGDKVLGYNTVLAESSADIHLSSTQLNIVFKTTTDSYRIEEKLSFSSLLVQARPLIGYNGETGKLTNRKFKPGEFFACMEPCWFRVQQPAGDLSMLKKKVIAYLNMGKDTRLLVSRTYMDVVETILEGDEIYTVLDPDTNSHSTQMFAKVWYKTYKNSFITSETQYYLCYHTMESKKRYSRPHSPGSTHHWFVDSHNWKDVYAVFSNGTVAKGELSELRKAINTEARTVRLRLSWLHLSRVRYLDTIMSAVLDTGKVVTETRSTWKLTKEKSLGVAFSSKCDKEIILVNSEGRIEVARYNVFTPGVSKVLTDDLLITWFIS